MNRKLPPIKLGLVGCGSIGTALALALRKKKSRFQVSAIFDTHLPAAMNLASRLSPSPAVCTSLWEMLRKCSWVLEAASLQAAPFVAEQALRRRKPVILLSPGGFFMREKVLTRLAIKYRTKIYLPSGAVCAMDGLKAARQGGALEQVEITSTKNSRGFLGAPGLTSSQRKMLQESPTSFKLYSGDVRGALKRFPANVNVAATLALASKAGRRIKVTIVADPRISFNQHAIHAKGAFGEMTAVTRNLPSTMNPKTSALAFQSALALLERLESYVEVGS